MKQYPTKQMIQYVSDASEFMEDWNYDDKKEIYPMIFKNFLLEFEEDLSGMSNDKKETIFNNIIK